MLFEEFFRANLHSRWLHLDTKYTCERSSELSISKIFRRDRSKFINIFEILIDIFKLILTRITREMLFNILSTQSSLLREDIEIAILKSSCISQIGFKGASKPVGKGIWGSYVNRFTDMQVISHNFYYVRRFKWKLYKYFLAKNTSSLETFYVLFGFEIYYCVCLQLLTVKPCFQYIIELLVISGFIVA